MPRHPLIPAKHTRRLVWVAVVAVLIVALVNVPFAVTRIRSRTAPRPRYTIDLRGPSAAPKGWPARTPHAEPWPDPVSWARYGAFGYRHYDVRWSNPVQGRNGFTMDLEVYGWPLGVLEQKQMWWDWDDPALAGPEHDPPLALRPLGLIANPLIVGLSVWAIIALPWTLVVVLRRARRSLAGRCLACGYDAQGLDRCPECGEPG